VLQYNSSCKYNSLDIVVSAVSTYSWSQFIEMPLFTVCIFIDIHRLISAFSIQTDEVPVLRTDLLCVGRYCLLLRKDFARWSQSVSQPINQSLNQSVHLSFSPSVRLSISQSDNRSVSQTVSQSISQ
jgi:hypothetical protein